MYFIHTYVRTCCVMTKDIDILVIKINGDNGLELYSCLRCSYIRTKIGMSYLLIHYMALVFP